MLSLHLETYDKEGYTLPVLVRWDLEYTGGVPCDSMTATCLYDAGMADVLPKATRFTAYRDGDIMLRGVVDAYEISLSRQGLTATIEGRGMAALLLDNESEALTYERALLSEILGNHVSPYGISVDARQSVSGDRYAVPSGSSQWGSGQELTVADDSPLLSLRKRESRYGVISQVLIQDKVQGVSHPVINREFARTGGQRRHVLYMPRSTAEDRRYTGEYQIEQSALEQLEIELELPFPFAAMPGDRVGLALKRLNLNGQYDVVRSRSRMDGDGERTELTLSRR